MITDAQYAAWLRHPNVDRVVLCELHHADGVEYVANKPYLSKPTDSAPNRIYDDLLAEANDIETRLDGQVSFGDITLIDSGELFGWFDRAWHGHDIRLYLGQGDWSLDDFRLLAVGRNNGITDATNGRLTFEMTDRSEDLEAVIETGELPDDAGPVPLLLGKVFNVPTHRVSTQTLRYRVSYLPLIAVQPRDNGVSVGHAKHLASGEFTLDNNTNGTITASAHEAHDTPSQVVSWVADHYGLEVAEVAMPEITVGLYFDVETSGSEILERLCSGLGGYWFLDRLGRLVVRQLAQPSGFTSEVITPDDMTYQGTTLETVDYPWRSLTYRWGENHATLSEVAGVVHDQDPNLAKRLQEPWRSLKTTLDQPRYPQALEEERDSVITERADAEEEARRLLALRSTRREIWGIDTFLPMLDVGQVVEVDHPRMRGRPALVTAVSLTPGQGRSRIEVWVGGYWAEGEMAEAAERIRVAVNEDLYENNGEDGE